MKKYNSLLLRKKEIIVFKIATFLTILLFNTQLGNSQVINLSCQDETDRFIGLYKKMARREYSYPQ